MFRPATLRGKLFKRYLAMFSHPSKIRIQNLIGKYFFPKGIQLVNADGLRFVLDANDWITRTILADGNYESVTTKLAKKILEHGGVFIDVGSNFGLFTNIAAYQNEKVKVLAVEPNYKILPRLLHHLNINGLEKRVQVMNVAVSEKLQFVTMEQPAVDNMGTNLTKSGQAGLLNVMSCPLEFICSTYKEESITLLKVDIEGNEFVVLKDFPFERYYIKNIILEFNHSSDISFETWVHFFKEKGFSSFTVTGDPLYNEDQGIVDCNIWFVNNSK